jgi:hypothetical protein
MYNNEDELDAVIVLKFTHMMDILSGGSVVVIYCVGIGYGEVYPNPSEDEFALNVTKCTQTPLRKSCIECDDVYPNASEEELVSNVMKLTLKPLMTCWYINDMAKCTPDGPGWPSVYQLHE